MVRRGGLDVLGIRPSKALSCCCLGCGDIRAFGSKIWRGAKKRFWSSGFGLRLPGYLGLGFYSFTVRSLQAFCFIMSFQCFKRCHHTCYAYLNRPPTPTHPPKSVTLPRFGSTVRTPCEILQAREGVLKPKTLNPKNNTLKNLNPKPYALTPKAPKP